MVAVYTVCMLILSLCRPGSYSLTYICNLAGIYIYIYIYIYICISCNRITEQVYVSLPFITYSDSHNDLRFTKNINNTANHCSLTSSVMPSSDFLSSPVSHIVMPVYSTSPLPLTHCLRHFFSFLRLTTKLSSYLTNMGNPMSLIVT